jgi:KaiC/GvpD/RAD55 family RecA-like ATPase
MAFMMALTHCYISSLKNRNLAYDYKVLDEEGRKITINEKNRRDADKVSAKYDVKREEMMNKYDTFKEYKKNNP